MVSFRQLNLLKNLFPDSTANLSDIDLIVCRNVFIYFDRPAVTRVITKFTQTLQVGGYLVTGHAELHDQKPSGLCLKAFPESAIYQRQSARTQTLKPNTPQTPAADVAFPASQSISSSGRVPNKPPAAPPAPAPRLPLVETCRAASSPAINDSARSSGFSGRSLPPGHGYADVGNYGAAVIIVGWRYAKDSLAEKPYYLAGSNR